MTTISPLTPEQEEQRKALNRQAQLADWQIRDDKRKQDLLALQPIEEVFDGLDIQEITTKLWAARPSVTDSGLLVRMDRVIQILENDGMNILNHIRRLQTPEPQPSETLIVPPTPAA